MTPISGGPFRNRFNPDVMIYPLGDNTAFRNLFVREIAFASGERTAKLA